MITETSRVVEGVERRLVRGVERASDETENENEMGELNHAAVGPNAV